MPRSLRRAFRGAVAASDPKDTTGAVAAWLMNEATGPIVDAVGGISVTEDGSFVYLVAGGIWTPGITFDGSSGFHIGTHQAAMDPGTGSFNIFIAFSATTPGSSAQFIGTTNEGTGNPGYRVRMNGASLNLEMVATDTTYVVANWSRAENPSFDAAFDGAVHTLEVQANRTTGFANLYVDSTIVTIQDVDISGIAGKNITGTGVGIGCDYRGTFGSTFTGNIYFLRQKNSVT